MEQCQIKLFYNFLTARLVTSIEKHQQCWALDLGLQINSAKWYTETIILKILSIEVKS